MTTCSSKSAFFLIRKELRSISGKFWTLSFELRQLERQMNILDARGQGQGLSQADVKVYRNAQARQWWLEDRLQALAHPLQAYGQQLVALLAEIGQDLTPEERIALLGGRHQAFRGPSWEGCPLEATSRRERRGGRLHWPDRHGADGTSRAASLKWGEEPWLCQEEKDRPRREPNACASAPRLAHMHLRGFDPLMGGDSRPAACSAAYRVGNHDRWIPHEIVHQSPPHHPRVCRCRIPACSARAVLDQRASLPRPQDHGRHRDG